MPNGIVAFKPGQVWQLRCPFIQEEKDIPDVDGVATIKSWRPGIRYKAAGPEDSAPVNDGYGYEFREVVAVVVIPGWPTRICYTRHYQTPDGKRFGKRRLRITTLAQFRRWATYGYWRTHNDLEREVALLVQEESEAA